MSWPRRFRGLAGNRKDRTPLTPIAAPRAKARRVPEPVSKRPDAEETLRLILARLDDMKAEDTVTIDLTAGLIADAVVVTSGLEPPCHRSRTAPWRPQQGRPERHPRRKEERRLVLIDAGGVIIHVFRPEVRAFYV